MRRQTGGRGCFALCTRRVPQCGDSAHSDVSAVLINQQLKSYEWSLRVRIPPAPPSPLFMRISANLHVSFAANMGGLADLPHLHDLSFWLNSCITRSITAIPRLDPCIIAQASCTL